MAQQVEAAAVAVLDDRSREVFAKIDAIRQEGNPTGELRQLIYAGEISYILIRRGAQAVFPPDEESALPKVENERRQLLSVAADLYSRSDPPQGWYADVSGSVYFRCSRTDKESVCFTLNEATLRPDLISALNTAAKQALGWVFLLHDPYNRVFWGDQPRASSEAFFFSWNGPFRGWTLQVGGSASPPTSLVRLLALSIPLALFWFYFVWTLGRRQSEKLAQIDSRKAFLARIAHDLRTPLSNLKLYCELISQESQGNARAENHCATLSAEVDRLDQLAANATAYGRSQPPRLSKAIPDEAASRLLERFERRFAASGVVCTIAASETAPLLFDVGAFERILVNLLDNACKFAPGPITLTTQFEDGRLCLEVCDNGPGLKATTAVAPSGSGLGLSIIHDLAEANGGSVSLINGQNGLRVIVTLKAELLESDALDAAYS